jgi:hypothetical protein
MLVNDRHTLSGNRHRVLMWLVFLALAWSPSWLAQADDGHFTGVPRIVAIGDVHGAYDALLETLQAAGVLDRRLSWAAGDTHLVFTGDLLDRGPDSRRVMDLVMRLERESVLAGGRVHQLLGNHEVMNLIGDLRYVSLPEYAAFTEEESTDERDAWSRWYERSQPADVDPKALRSEFEKKAPPGFFAYRRAFRSDGVYGKWLLEKPLMVVVNDVAFVHGGVPPYVEEHGLAGVNGQLKQDLVDYVHAQAKLVDAGIVSPMHLFREIPPILEAALEAGQLDGDLRKVAQDAIELTDSPLHGPDGPTWYRGTAVCNPLMEADGLDRALARIGAKRVVFGHTTTVTRRIQQRMDGQIVEIDTGMLKARYRGSGNALIIEGDVLTAVNQDGTTQTTLLPHPLSVGGDTEDFSDDLLADILTSGMIVDTNPDVLPWRLVQVTAGERTVFAQFDELQGVDGFAPELAAYRLDRMLGLYMVPVTVRRQYNGRPHTLQHVPAATISERSRLVDDRLERMYCAPARQAGMMYVFDALINNPFRSPLSMLYGEEDGLLMLVDHGQAFAADGGLTRDPEGIELKVGGQWHRALAEIDDEALRANLADVLDRPRMDALSERRDALIRMTGRWTGWRASSSDPDLAQSMICPVSQRDYR